MATRTARKATARKATAPAAPAKPAKSADDGFSYGSLAVAEETALPGAIRGVNVADTPFPAALQASWDARTAGKRGREYGTARSVTVPAARVAGTVRVLRASAESIGVGVRIVEGKPDNGNVTIAFRAQTKRASK